MQPVAAGIDGIFEWFIFGHFEIETAEFFIILYLMECERIF
jgi:hypothetical protein